MATTKEKAAIHSELDKLFRTGTTADKAMVRAILIINDDLMAVVAKNAALEKQVANLEKRLR